MISDDDLVLPIHNCVKIGLENEYFKEKLTEFYKENKKLKEEIQRLTNESGSKRTPNQSNKSTSPIRVDLGVSISPKTAPQNKEATEPDIKKPLSNKSSDANLYKSIFSVNSSGGQKCSVCQKANTKKSSSFSKNRSTQTDAAKTSTATNTFDKDFYNKQNKVSQFCYFEF